MQSSGYFVSKGYCDETDISEVKKDSLAESSV